MTFTPLFLLYHCLRSCNEKAVWEEKSHFAFSEILKCALYSHLIRFQQSIERSDNLLSPDIPVSCHAFGRNFVRWYVHCKRGISVSNQRTYKNGGNDEDLQCVIRGIGIEERLPTVRKRSARRGHVLPGVPEFSRCCQAEKHKYFCRPLFSSDFVSGRDAHLAWSSRNRELFLGQADGSPGGNDKWRGD